MRALNPPLVSLPREICLRVGTIPRMRSRRDHRRIGTKAPDQRIPQERIPKLAPCCASSPHELPAPPAAAPASPRCAHPRCSTRAPAASAPLHIVATSAPLHPHWVRHATPRSAQEQANSKQPPRTPAIPNTSPIPASSPLPNVLLPVHLFLVPCSLFPVH